MTTTKADETISLKDYEAYLSPAVAKSTDLVVDHASGQYLWDVNGKRYIDWVQGIAVNALGHVYPSVVNAAKQQIEKLMTASFNVVSYPSTLKLARRIAQITPGNLNTVMFSNGGAEATDGAIKLARVATSRPAVIAFKGSFHGRTMGAISITASNAAYRKGLEPMMGGVYFAPYPSRDLCPEGYDAKQRADWCLGEIKKLFKYVVVPQEVACFYVEPLQGEGGYVVPDPSFLKGLRALADEYGIMLIFDEIQSGYGRTGKMFAGEHAGVIPDIMTLGKAIAGGLAMSAVVSTPEIMEKWRPGMHGTTFGANPVASATGLAVLDEFEKQHIVENSATVGAFFKSKLVELQTKFPFIADVRGLGMMLAIEFGTVNGKTGADIFSEVSAKALEKGLLLLGCGADHDAIRFAAPLNSTQEDIEEGLAIFEEVLATV
ncbi:MULTISPECIES: aspartate aminotransferase family protein [Bifidobacterium]|jgi:4-aminobutyrate aminotransferase|uniref:aspartate aminotransferase family protein n=1 Tax=Bifidobacterium TaxID=1678 RepID=UPI00192A3602|nr:aspartate aminotransferase family protein [Bifidobacterium tibiigranuli]MCI1210690.1 aspartate aminotransferase family protein [Bifidobacterium tibiigranuli]